MRTSHIAIRKRIEDATSKITDEELFASGAFAGYLADLAEAAAKRYHRPLKVKVIWDEDDGAEVAYTDNRSIVVNAANFVTRSFPTRVLRADSLIGMGAHEIGHVIFTDFNIREYYLSVISSGRFYPAEPSGLSYEEEQRLQEIVELFGTKDRIAMKAITKVVANLTNIIEDVYIEMCMCEAFPGSFKTGIMLNNLRFSELMPSILAQIEKGVFPLSIVMNLIIQYCKCGDVNNLGDYEGEYLNVLTDCIPVLDEAYLDDNPKARFAMANMLLVKLWEYVKEFIEKAREQEKDGIATVDEMLEQFAEQIAKMAADPSGKSKPSPSAKGVRSDGESSPSAVATFDKEAFAEEMAALQEVLDHETGRIPLEKTVDIDESGDGGITYNKDYAESGYPSAGADISRMLTNMATETVHEAVEQELTKELQDEADKIRLGNAHKGIHIRVNRIAHVSPATIESYNCIASSLLKLSKRMQKQVLQVLKDRREGGKQTGLLFGKRLDARALVHDNGRVFYNNRLPGDDLQLAVALLLDESGSMRLKDRTTIARAASIVIYDFCIALGIPIAIYGHTAHPKTVEMNAYAEFDSIDKKDKFRLMDISARSDNRDGAALRFAAERLMSRHETTKLLINVSDGEPYAPGYYGTEAEADLRGIKREYTRKGITMFAAAIGDDKPNIERIYGKGFLDVTDLNKLPINLTRLISQHIKL